MKRALEGVPVTDFNQPPPIQPPASAVKEDPRKGFNPGSRRYPSDVPGEGPYVYSVQTPDAARADADDECQPAPSTVPSTTSPAAAIGN